jgi:hypothetical protein
MPSENVVVHTPEIRTCIAINLVVATRKNDSNGHNYGRQRVRNTLNLIFYLDFCIANIV